MRTLTRILTGVFTAIGLAIPLVGAPIGLAAAAGWPLPRHWPTAGDWIGWATSTNLLTDRVLLDGFAVAMWLLWAWYAYRLLTEVVRRARRVRLPRPRLPVRREGLVGALAGALVLGTGRLIAALHTGGSDTALAAHTSTPAPATDPHLNDTQVDDTAYGAAQAGSRVPAGAFSPVPAAVSTPRAPTASYTVVEGDSLWDIAGARLGDPDRWQEIYRLNHGRPQTDGCSLQDPDDIHVGWILALPADTPTRPAVPPAAPPPAAGHQPPRSHTAEPHPPATPTAPSSSTGPSSTSPSPAPASPATSPSTSPPASPSASHTDDRDAGQGDRHGGIALPAGGWVSLGLAAAIAAVAGLLRLRRRRRARLRYPIPLGTEPRPAPVSDSLRPVDAAGSRLLTIPVNEQEVPTLVARAPGVPAPIGVDAHGRDVGLFALPGPGLALTGDGAPGAARALIASVLATEVTGRLPARPVMVVPSDTLSALLPDGADPAGLDPRHETFDGERLLVVADTAAVLAHLETEMIGRRRLLEDMGVATVEELNAGEQHVEQLPPCVMLLPADPRHSARILAIAAHRSTLHLYPVLLGATSDLPQLDLAADGTITTTEPPDGSDRPDGQLAGGRLGTLSAQDLVEVLGMIADAAPRPETSNDTSPPEHQPEPETVHIPRPRPETSGPPVQLRVLGPPTLATRHGPITTGVRRGSLAVLTVLAAHPTGRTYQQLAADLHPDTNDTQTSVNRVRTDLNAARSLLREATGISGRGKFVIYNRATDRYRIDPDLIDVDLWRMLAALQAANTASDDNACLAALHEAVDCYGGDFADGHDRAWVTDYATTYRHQLLAVYARIAEILETDHPDQAIAALENAIDHDPINEELYQRLMRIHGRLDRPDAVRRALRLLEDRLDDLAEAEPSETTRRIAARQLALSLGGHR